MGTDVLKKCTICGEPKALDCYDFRRSESRSGRRSECKECRKKARQKNPSPGKSAPERERARVRAATQYAIEQGQLVPGVCRICGSTEVEAHHLSYDDPGSHLDVQWLCKRHHAREHGSRSWAKQRELFPGGL